MKKMILLAILAVAALAASGQEETLFSNLSRTGAFGGPFLEASTINGDLVVDVGGGGALILNNFFLGGYGLGTKLPRHEVLEEPGKGLYDIHFRHGGLWLGFVAPEHKVIHFYSSVRLGWGRASLEMGEQSVFSDGFFAVTPELGFELNVTSFLKVGFSGGYRIVNGISKLPELSVDDFNSPMGTLTFRFGGFSSWNSKKSRDTEEDKEATRGFQSRL